MPAPNVVSVSPVANATDVVLSFSRSSGRPFYNLIGKRFGKLVVLHQLARPTGKPARWACVCDCGKEHTAITHLLISGKVTRCRKCAFADIGYAKRVPDRAFRLVLRSYQKSARHKDHEFVLSSNEFRSLITQDCHYCGEPPSRIVKRVEDQIVCNGLDRMDSSRGYTMDNCVPCCTRCNMIKRDMPYQEFVAWIRQSAKYLERY